MPRARPAAIARQHSAASWQVNALVEATPISGPASVGITHVAFARDGRGRHVDDGENVLLLLLGIAQASPACRRSRPTARRRSRGRPSRAAPRGSGIRTRHRSRPAAARSARTSIWRSARRNRRCRRPRSRCASSLREIERQRRHAHALGRHVEVMRERVADDFRLLVDFLRHEMAMVALVDQERRRDSTSGPRARPACRPRRAPATPLRLSTAQSPSSR